MKIRLYHINDDGYFLGRYFIEDDCIECDLSLIPEVGEKIAAWHCDDGKYRDYTVIRRKAHFRDGVDFIDIMLVGG